MFRSKPLKDQPPRQNRLLNSLTSSKMALSGRSLPALPGKPGGTEKYLRNETVDPFVIMKYENLKARSMASRAMGAKGGRALIESLQQRKSLQVTGTTVRSTNSSENDIPKSTMSHEQENITTEGRNNDKDGRAQSPPKKPTKLPSLVMMPSMVVGDVKQIRKLRRPSQVDDVKNVKVHNLIELRPLADEKDDTVSPSLELDTERAAKRALARSLWFPVNEQNINRAHAFIDNANESSGSFEKRLHARINSYIRNNSSPGCIRTALDFTKTEVPNMYSQQLGDDNAQLRFHFSQLELEVGKSLKEDGVSPTPNDVRNNISKYDVIDPVLRHSPILLRKGLRDALKLPADGCPRASMRSELVQAEGLKHPLKTLKLRRDYAKNLERNWMRRHMIEQRLRRKERELRITVGNWISARVNMATQDFSRAFYSSDDVTEDEEDIEEGIDDVITDLETKAMSREAHPSATGESLRRVSFGDTPASPTRWSTVTTDETNFRNSFSYHPGFTTPQHFNDGEYPRENSALQGWNSQEFVNKAELGFENQPSTLHRRLGYHEDAFSEASMEVQYSDLDVEANECAVEIVLKDGQLYDRYVKNKTKRQHRRMRKRFETLVLPESSDEEETEKNEEEIARMTDTELRAMRLKLNKQEEEDNDPAYTRNITSALLRDLSRLTSSASAKKKKKKKKKKSQKPAKMDTMTVRERFVKDFGWLLNNQIKSRLLANKSIFSTSSSQMGESMNDEAENAEKVEEKDTFASFLNIIEEDLDTLRSLDPEAIGFRKKEKKERQKVLRRKKEFQKIYDAKMAAIRAERERKLQEDGGEREEANEETEKDTEQEQINPEEWEYVTESDEDESDADDITKNGVRRSSFAGRTKPDKLIYDKLIEKPIPIKPKSPLKSGKSSRTVSKIGSPIKRSTPAIRVRSGSQESIQGSFTTETGLAPQDQRNVVGTSPSMEATNDSKGQFEDETAKTESISQLRDDFTMDEISQHEEMASETDINDTSQHNDDEKRSTSTEDSLPKPRDGYFFDTEIAEIDTRCLRRAQSWHGLRWDDEEISLHDLLEGIDLPAKEVKIQVVNRRRKRQRQKMEQQRKQEAEMQAKQQAEVATNESDNVENGDGAVAEYDTSDNESTATTCRLSFSEDAPFLSAYLQWNRENKYKSEFTDEQLDEEIEDLSDLFWQMKDCRYIRWGKRDQAIITRLFELDLFDR